MPILDLYEHGDHRKNLAHFATLASLAAIDGEINPKEKAILEKFAFKLNITEEEIKEVMKKDNKYPIETPHSGEKRYKRLFEFFQIIFSDHDIDEGERKMVERYAIGLGFSPKKATEIIDKSIKIFTGKIPFEDYFELVKRES
ncbi:MULTISPECIES: TerB family tellurite resistance protein [Flagellimonas]|uniref:TerB family tellurite resistance protein n=2 Tax=Flagellimonas TaxID=444459 RepID=A0A3A1NKI3_9FLAO|nr:MULTISPECIES: TerB family tellurite resistance protein [Allomuricauda]RIV46496.1 TerB family tellurite resistance protein [Allomuricauda maritima]RIV73171.1 TerB family tellurite resistance protein [Allomuricauda aequoris]TXJ99158.1 TerB family tellurite resistance protein [Allomuricauda maritima]TXK06977.1 TerB family tellurite resistance protein [Allomuricauda aequoris]